MKQFVPFLAMAAIVAVAVAIAFRRLAPEPKPTVVYSQGPTVERLEQLKHLVTMRVYIADVLTGEGDGHRGAWLIRGDALLGVNLGRGKIIEKNEEAKRATLWLPEPGVLQCRVDHERTRTWEVRRTTWVPWSGDQDKLRDQVMWEAQKLVAHAANSSENFRRCWPEELMSSM